MTRNLAQRVAKLEAASRSAGVVHVVSGHSDEELKRKADELLASGRATPADLIVQIRRFAGT